MSNKSSTPEPGESPGRPIALVTAVKESLSADDIEQLKSTTEDLMTASQGFAQRMYEEAAQNEAGEETTIADDDDDIVDAEIIDEDD